MFKQRYENDLRRGLNRFRWLEYSIAGANVAMISFGWLQALMNPPGREHPIMIAFWFGTIAGLAPWIAIVVNILGAHTAPGFVYGIFGSLFVLFASFGLNQYRQYKKIGSWVSHAFGEKVHLVLSLAAKSALAWQIFSGSLAG